MIEKSLEIWFKDGRRDSVDSVDPEDVTELDGKLVVIQTSGNAYYFDLETINRYEWFEEFYSNEGDR